MNDNHDRFKNLCWDSEVVSEVISVHAKNIPNNTFIYYGERDQSITYGEFYDSRNSIANGLLSIGVKKGDRISVFLNNPMICMHVMHAIWAVGAVYCPINNQYKGNLLSYQINDTNPSVIITEEALFERVDHFEEFAKIPTIVYRPKRGDHDYAREFVAPRARPTLHYFDELLECSKESVVSGSTPQDIANIIYTSGTTGPAKGAVQCYRFMNSFTYPMRAISTSENAVYNDIPLYHVGAVCWNLNRAVWLGAKVGLWDRFSPSRFWSRIKTCGASTATLIDVMIPRLLSAPESPDDKDHLLRIVNMQPLPNYMREFTRRFGVDYVTCGFGQTESGISLIAVIEGLSPEERKAGAGKKGLSADEIRRRCGEIGVPYIAHDVSVPSKFLGGPTPFYEVSIRDPNDERVEHGTAGEICLRPKRPNIIMNGYFNKDAASLKTFKNLWYHTGDSGLENADGTFCFIDRLSGFIRVKGENISSYQVEEIVNSHPNVNLSAAAGVPAQEGEEDDLAIFIEPRDPDAVEYEELASWLAENLPHFMQPKFVRLCAEMPRTPTNKIQKFVLVDALKKEAAPVREKFRMLDLPVESS